MKINEWGIFVERPDNSTIDLPNGWTCIECGDEYLKDIEGQFVDDYTEGTLCKKCNQQTNKENK